MSKPRYDWWSYVKGMIRRYPRLREEWDAVHESCIIANYGGGVRGGAPGRTTEMIAIRELPSVKQREYEAVRRAIDLTREKRDGEERLSLVDMVIVKRTHLIAGAAQRLHVSEMTARRWHKEFILTVAGFYGLLEK